ncbi:MAG: divalent-cation tolerance protein CutA [Desulfovibrionaceae bacterium]|nr:divalent-cation tolerance protein CutA [Desulfovibrionaceae bacterium]
MSNDILLVYITAPDQESARKIAGALLAEKLAACANILPDAESLFFWKGELRQRSESILLLKTHKSLFDRLMQRARELHEYELPCIVALPLAAGLPDFLSWVTGEVDV